MISELCRRYRCIMHGESGLREKVTLLRRRPTYIIRTHPDQAERNTLDDRLLKFAPASARTQKRTDGAGSARPAGPASTSTPVIPPPAAAPSRPTASWSTKPSALAQTGMISHVFMPYLHPLEQIFAAISWWSGQTAECFHADGRYSESESALAAQ